MSVVAYVKCTLNTGKKIRFCENAVWKFIYCAVKKVNIQSMNVMSHNFLSHADYFFHSS